MNAGRQARDDDVVEIAWVARRANHVSKTIKGTLVAMAAALALEASKDPGAAAMGLIGTVVAIAFANTYGHWLQTEIAEERRLGIAAIPGVAVHTLGVLLGALPAVLLFLAAWLEVIDTTAAVDLTLWAGIGLLFVFGFVGGRLRGDTRSAAIIHGLLLAVVGIGVLAVKYLI